MKAMLSGILFISTLLATDSMLPAETLAADYTCTFRGGREMPMSSSPIMTEMGIPCADAEKVFRAS
jgi:hypothetical protein